VLDSTQIQRIAERLDARFGLDALWLFGSEARGTAGVRSDLDLAALFRRKPSRIELLEAREELADSAGRDVDLLDLEQVSPILAIQVLRHGELLVDANPARRQRFVAAAPGRYEDLRIVRREAERALLERVRGGRA
jgi:predicted nucleotidyltransferase